jgi:hypothetical protein
MYCLFHVLYFPILYSFHFVFCSFDLSLYPDTHYTFFKFCGFIADVNIMLHKIFQFLFYNEFKQFYAQLKMLSIVKDNEK